MASLLVPRRPQTLAQRAAASSSAASRHLRGGRSAYNPSQEESLPTAHASRLLQRRLASGMRCALQAPPKAPPTEAPPITPPLTGAPPPAAPPTQQMVGDTEGPLAAGEAERLRVMCLSVTTGNSRVTALLGVLRASGC